ncbi:putative Oligosaccharide translocation protein RFT1 [Seiridium cardinale]|uniref:Man(5)GlcNAc(2)-PP-dolichol translocation protein RFT1 n=1 Tax=Seiridium cardinale TaxID=138064 RepID=A0ABR2XE95_9PEZI
MGASAQGSAVRGASLLIILQIISRAITFIANQLLLRFLTAKLLGVSTQLEVYYLSVLFFARESLRVAIQRQGSTGGSAANSGGTANGPKTSHDSQSVVNVGHLALVLGLGASVALGGAYLHYVDPETASTAYLSPALYIYGLAAIVELLSEPAFVVLQHRLRFGPRAAAESIATFFRCLVTFGTANWAWRNDRELGVLPFALGQMGYGIGLLAVYLWYGWGLASSEGFSLFPRRITSTPSSSESNKYTLGCFYTPTLQLASSLTAQSFVKHILTQGDTFLVSVLSSPQSQGVYALANNYGSLLARLVFQPVEESSRNYFSKLLSTSEASAKDEKDTSVPAKLSKENINRAKADLQSLFKSYTLLSILVVTLGPFGAPLLVQIIAGREWAASGAGGVLAQYCLYIPLLALNGISEAFVSSVASKSEVHRQSLWMGAFSVMFGVAGFVFLRVLDLGAVGLVYANSINMLCRILWSSRFISGYFGRNAVDFAWVDAIPTGSAIYVLGTAALWQALYQVAGLSVGGVSDHVYRDVAKVVGFALPYIALMAYMERRLLIDSYRSVRGRR